MIVNIMNILITTASEISSEKLILFLPNLFFLSYNRTKNNLYK